MNADTKIPAHEQYAGIFAVYYIVFYHSGSSLVTQSLIRRKMRCFRLRRSQSV